MKTLITTLLLAVAVFAHAQKLPGVQQKSFLAPQNLKIDGKTNEWGGFQAYNNATGLYYTIANDDKNLYLAIQASDPNVLTKITNQGIILKINSPGEKNTKNVISIQYPVFELKYQNKPFIKFSNTSGLTADQRREILGRPDSMLAVANKRLKTNDKYIRISGIVDVDTLLSVYNEKDIVARQGFDKWELYNYELAIPLKYINLNGGANAKFAYQIILKGISVDVDYGYKIITHPGGKRELTYAPGFVSVQNRDMPAVTSTTDFLGEYTLAK